jgi:hypothetical protein
MPTTKRIYAPLTKTSAEQVERALKRLEDDFPDWTIDRLELRRTSADVSELVIVLVP